MSMEHAPALFMHEPALPYFVAGVATIKFGGIRSAIAHEPYLVRMVCVRCRCIFRRSACASRDLRAEPDASVCQ